jgi:hypothetical protein
MKIFMTVVGFILGGIALILFGAFCFFFIYEYLI